MAKNMHFYIHVKNKDLFLVQSIWFCFFNATCETLAGTGG
jgi:hypothetical protein